MQPLSTSPEERGFSSIDFVAQCLVDEERTKAFQAAIQEKVKAGSTALDLGTGSGIMALTASKAGAKKVYAVEYDPFVASIARDIFEANDVSDEQLTLLIDDARTVTFPEGTKFDVVISEMLTTAMVDEHQVRAMNHLHEANLVDANTSFIPERQDTLIALASVDYSWLGVAAPMILHLWKWHNWVTLKLEMLSASATLHSIDFRKVNEESVDSVIELTAQASGTINSLYITSASVLTDKITVRDTEALNAPMLIPVPPRKVKKSDKIRVKIAYAFGNGYENFKAELI